MKISIGSAVAAALVAAAVPMAPATSVSGTLRPPAPIPHVASRGIPLPRTAPPRADAPAVGAKPADAQAEAAPRTAAASTRPAPAIQPTQPMPPAQGLD